MDAKKALDEMTEALAWKPESPHSRPYVPSYAALDQAVDALREKVAREEAAKPKRPSLEEMEEDLRSTALGACSREVGMHMTGAGERRANVLHAADILKTLRERGGELLASLAMVSSYQKLLRDLGVQPKEA